VERYKEYRWTVSDPDLLACLAEGITVDEMLKKVPTVAHWRALLIFWSVLNAAQVLNKSSEAVGHSLDCDQFLS